MSLVSVFSIHQHPNMPKAPSTPAFPLNGLFPIAKPSGPTSMRVIDSINPLLLESRLFDDPNVPPHQRNNFRHKRKKNATHHGLKIGQGGTLDPLADGVLVIGVNRGTKHLNRFLECSKEYVSVGLLGASTNTYDSEGAILSTGNSDHVTRESIEAVLDKFRGKIQQTPPIYSALKMDGKPLYEYARECKPLPRPIPVRDCEVSIDLLDFQEAEVTPGDGGHTYNWPTERLSTDDREIFRNLDKLAHDAGGAAAEAPKLDLDTDVPEVSQATGKRPAIFKVRMTVSSGTYVRSIVHDIGLALGCGAHVVVLTRTRQGEFVLHGDEEELLAREAEQEAPVAPAAEMTEEEAMNAAPSEKKEVGPSTGCIPWEVFERALAERNETIKSEEAEKEEMIASGASASEVNAKFSREAIARKRREGPLKEWENELLRRFVPVALPVVRDSKSRAAGLC